MITQPGGYSVHIFSSRPTQGLRIGQGARKLFTEFVLKPAKYIYCRLPEPYEKYTDESGKGCFLRDRLLASVVAEAYNQDFFVTPDG